MTPFIPQNWYWSVGGSTSQVYSSAIGDYVPVSDPTYVVWLSRGNVPTRIDTEASLGAVIAAGNAPRPISATILDSFLTAKINATDQVQFKVLFNHENRIRTLAGQANISTAQFITAIKGLI